MKYSQDYQKPGPSTTHTISEINEIIQALQNNTQTQTQHTKPSETQHYAEYEDYLIGPKGKEPFKGPGKSKNQKLKQKSPTSVITWQPPKNHRNTITRTEFILKYATTVSTIPLNNPVRQTLAKCNTKFQIPTRLSQSPSTLNTQPTSNDHSGTEAICRPKSLEKTKKPIINMDLKNLGNKHVNPWKILMHIQELLGGRYRQYTHLHRWFQKYTTQHYWCSSCNPYRTTPNKCQTTQWLFQLYGRTMGYKSSYSLGPYTNEPKLLNCNRLHECPTGSKFHENHSSPQLKRRHPLPN
ncbi:hypothetical protein CHS0354_037171 [Potamilus streckersoni]|uniref:Uncharacterized protein n=1 Tax=Potamilus streckersoni TaxID=2493646 RepID=A0AAE0W488_9BIVA|nr:hypothetical protein CHS0354_037171 [Potamilus streckersoni]